MTFREKAKLNQVIQSLKMDIVDLHSLANIDRQQYVCARE